jgi:hypothetical protein
MRRECIIFVQVLSKVFLKLFHLWLFRSFYIRRSSAENLVKRDFLTIILFQVYFDFALSKKLKKWEFFIEIYIFCVSKYQLIYF